MKNYSKQREELLLVLKKLRIHPTAEEIYQKLQTSEDGLSSKEAKKRLNRYGLNELPKKKPDSIIKIFFNELKDPIVLLLLVAIIASLIVEEYVDAIAIFIIVMVDFW